MFGTFKCSNLSQSSCVVCLNLGMQSWSAGVPGQRLLLLWWPSPSPKLILLRSKPPSSFQVKDKPSLCSSKAPSTALAEELAVSSVYLMYTPANASDTLQHQDVPTHMPHVCSLIVIKHAQLQMCCVWRYLPSLTKNQNYSYNLSSQPSWMLMRTLLD